MRLAVLALRGFQLLGHPGQRPGRLPQLISALLTQLFRLCDVQPVCAVVDVTDFQREEF